MSFSRIQLAFGTLFLVSLVCSQVSAADSAAQSCAQIIANGAENDERILLCQLYESSNLLAQLGVLVTEGLDQLMLNQGLLTEGEAETSDARQKRKHEYLRFGKRKHEYLRFGKRKHEYLRFGRK